MRMIYQRLAINVSCTARIHLRLFIVHALVNKILVFLLLFIQRETICCRTQLWSCLPTKASHQFRHTRRLPRGFNSCYKVKKRFKAKQAGNVGSEKSKNLHIAKEIIPADQDYIIFGETLNRSCLSLVLEQMHFIDNTKCTSNC